MRIVGGKYRGRHIKPPPKFRARPTTDFAKESLFNILDHSRTIPEMDVLDLFSGTGSISYEFASRGALSVLAVELDPSHCRFIKKTAERLEIEQLSPVQTDAFRFLRRAPQSFDLIFADPPYDHPALPEIPEMVFSTNILETGGLFILEHPAKYDFKKHPRFLQHRKYGGVNFSFFEQL